MVFRFFGEYVACALPLFAALWLSDWLFGPSGFQIYTSAVIIGFLVGIALQLVYTLYKDQLR